ncbi:MAG: asparaginase domain-containing protein [Bdellovibrionota bacterium]
MLKDKFSKHELRIIVSGGTFDKEYDEITGKLFFRDTHIAEMLQLGRSKLNVNVEVACMIDSLEMTDAHRELLLKSCLNCSEEQIIITHGTDTMEHTARFLAEARIAKTIILTGAMIPYKFGSSDGLFNLGAALAYAQSLDPGVYVAMNGRIFDARNVTKDRSTGEFKELSC